MLSQEILYSIFFPTGCLAYFSSSVVLITKYAICIRTCNTYHQNDYLSTKIYFDKIICDFFTLQIAKF